MTDLFVALLEVLLSVCLGGLIGLEREFGRKHLHKELPFGIRTTILVSLTGLVFVFLGNFIDKSVSIALGLMTILVLVVTNYYTRSRQRLIGMTSYFAIIISFLVGILIGFKQYFTAVIISVVTTGFLTVRRELHKIVRLMDLKELRATIAFAIIAFVILPVLPNTYIDPFKVFNPFKFWLTVILVTGLSFISYIALKIVKNGLSITGLLGGMISAKITVDNLARRVRVDKDARQDAFNAMLLSIASNITFCILISLFTYPDYSLFNYILLPLFLSSSATLMLFYRSSKKHHHTINYENPFSLGPALKFSFLLFAFTEIVAFTSKLVNPNLVYVVVLLSSLASVYASVASISSLMASSNISFMLGVNLFVFACVISILDKSIFAKVSRNKKLVSSMLKATVLWATLAIAILIFENYFAAFI